MRARALAVLVVLAAGCAREPAMTVAGGDVLRGEQLGARYGCVACHYIPGAANQGANVGPPLTKIAQRGYIGGVIPNTPDNMVRWLQNPPAVDPRSAMPNMGISEDQARDIAAWLYTME